MGLIKGTHHVALKCTGFDQYAECVKFYGEILGLEKIREWEDGCMFSTGNNIMEIFATGSVSGETGSVNHYALSTDDVDACVEVVRKHGYTITMEPNNVVVGSVPPYPLRIAFCIGPVGEEIEFFTEL